MTNYLEKRRFIRLSSIFPVAFHIISKRNQSSSNFWIQGYTSNVSKGGLCIETVQLSDEDFNFLKNNNGLLDLRVSIPLADPSKKAVGEVSWIRKEKRHGNAKFYIGVKFSSIAALDLKKILKHAKWLTSSTKLLIGIAIIIFISLLSLGGNNFFLKKKNSQLVHSFVELQSKESNFQNVLEVIEQRKKEVSSVLTHQENPQSFLLAQYEQLVKGQKQVGEQLEILRGEKSNLQDQVVEKMYVWLKNHQSPTTGLIMSFEGDVDIVKHWAFIYDQALAVNVFLLFEDFSSAQKILDFFNRNLTASFQGFSNAYYFDSGDVSEFTIHSGPNIWVGLAAMQYEHQTGDKRYRNLASHIADWIISVQDRDPKGGIKGGPEFSWFATEHNLDAYAFFNMLHNKTDEKKYKTARKKVLSWLEEYSLAMHSYDYKSPPINRGRGDATIATDTFSWAIAALGPEVLQKFSMDVEQIMKFAQEHCAVNVNYKRPSGAVVNVEGFDFAKYTHMPRGGMVSPEWTSQVIVSYQMLGDFYRKTGEDNKARLYSAKAQFYLNELSKLIISSSSAKGLGEGCLPYATLEDADTGHGWHTPLGTTTCSIAGTAYMIMAAKEFNPLMLK